MSVKNHFASILFWALLSGSIAPAALCADYYAAPNGSPSGNGSMSAPWDLTTALLAPAAVHPGDTLYLRAGTYKKSDGSYFYSKLTGTQSQYITVRPYAGERAIIDGGIEVDNSWVLFRDLEVMSSSPNRVSTQSTSWPTDVTQLVGFNVYGQGVKIVNNVIHDDSAGMDSWAQGTDDEFYGNIVFYNGWYSTVNGAHGHAFYMQNQSGAKKITDNIAFNQFDHGIHLYGTANAYLNNFVIEGNISFNNGSLGLYYSRNILLGGGNVAQNPTIRNNYMYNPPSSTLGGDNSIGYDSGGMGCSNLVLENNYWVSDGWALNLYKCTVTSLTGNTFYGQWKGISPGTYAGNQFYPLTAPPIGVKTFVRPNQYEAGRANIVIFNWDRLNTVAVDVSAAGLASGDSYEIRDVQNYLGAPLVTGTYNGSPISIPMTSTVITPPIGNVPYPPTHTDKEFQVFVIRKTSGGTAPPKDTTAPTVAILSPAAGQVVSGTMTLSAGASDNIGVAAVRFQLDGANIGSDLTSAPYSLTIDTKTVVNGSHTVTAVARDAAGNSKTSSPVVFSVNNVAPPAPVAAVLSNGAPSGSLPSSTVQTSLSLTTDQSATCRYSRTAGVSYSAMTGAFSSTGGASHSTLITGLTAGTSYSYYVRCQTAAGVANAADYVISFSVAAAVAPPAPPPPSQSYYGYMEGESGTLVAPMYVIDNPGASGGKFIRSNTTNLGSVTLTFTVPTSGNYIFWGRILSGNQNFDSFYVSVDGGPEDIYDTAQGTWSNAWQWTRVTGRAANGGTPSYHNVNPRVFTLPAGTHTIRFRGCETYTYLDRVLVTNDLQFVPK
jgi:hypothetical protein